MFVNIFSRILSQGNNVLLNIVNQEMQEDGEPPLARALLLWQAKGNMLER